MDYWIYKEYAETTVTGYHIGTQSVVNCYTGSGAVKSQLSKLFWQSISLLVLSLPLLLLNGKCLVFYRYYKASKLYLSLVKLKLRLKSIRYILWLINHLGQQPGTAKSFLIEFGTDRIKTDPKWSASSDKSVHWGKI